MSTLRTTTTATTAGACVWSQPQTDRLLLTDLFAAYYHARSNKRSTASQMKFERRLSENLIRLYNEILSRTYRPGRSMCFIISDPVKREVFAATFRDRVVHHYLYDKLEPVFERAFIYDSYSCRKGKGTLFGVGRLEHHIRSCSRNHTREAFVLKLDIEGYFMSIDRNILYDIIVRHIDKCRRSGKLAEGFDYDTVKFLLHDVVFLDPTKGCRIKGLKSDWKSLPASKSLFHSAPGCGLPIGNLTSQLFSNVYLGELDQFVKRTLKFEHYGRYVDDFYIVDESRQRLQAAIPLIEDFLRNHLHLRLNARKIRVIPASGPVPFLGSVVSPNGRRPERRSLKRMRGKYLEALNYERSPYRFASVHNSCMGYLSHFNAKHHLLSGRARLSGGRVEFK